VGEVPHQVCVQHTGRFWHSSCNTSRFTGKQRTSRTF